MKPHHLILENFFKIFRENLSNRTKFRILNIHDILEKDFDNLEKVLVNLKKNWEFIDPLLLGNINLRNKNSILLTFDDGYKSQKLFAKKILDKLNIRAIFFVVTNFLNCKNKQEAKNFVLKNVDVNIDKNLNRFLEVDNMNYEDLFELKSNNHVIGSHTVNHKKLTKITNYDELEYEVCESKNKLENMLKCSVDNFAYTYGDIKSINSKVFKILKKNYKNIFSGIRGNNFPTRLSTIFFRDELSPYYSEDLVNSFLNGYSDFYYYKKRKKLLSFENNV